MFTETFRVLSMAENALPQIIGYFKTMKWSQRQINQFTDTGKSPQLVHSS